MKGSLTKLSAASNAMRTPTMEGIFSNPPAPGHRFSLIGEALDLPDGIRWLETSLVHTVEFDVETGVYEFVTESGTVYRLETSMEEQIETRALTERAY